MMFLNMSDNIFDTFELNITAVSSNASVVDACAVPVNALPVYVAPPVDAWVCHKAEVITMLIIYVACFTTGQIVNWVCLTNLHKTPLTMCVRYVMTVQCAVNAAYLSINTPYKFTLLYLQHLFLPNELKIFCGWLHLFVILTGQFLQGVIAITRVLYIVYPMRAKQWFFTRKRSLIPALIPACFGFAYAAPAVYPCCYRFYKFSTFALSYVGPSLQTQLDFSVTAFAIQVVTLSTCYTWIFLKLRATSKNVHSSDDKKGLKRQKREIRITVLFGITGGVWFFYFIVFYTIYFVGPFPAYSAIYVLDETVEQLLLVIDPIIYLAMSSELRRPLLKLIGMGAKHPKPATTTSTTVTKVQRFRNQNKVGDASTITVAPAPGPLKQAFEAQKEEEENDDDDVVEDF